MVHGELIVEITKCCVELLRNINVQHVDSISTRVLKMQKSQHEVYNQQNLLNILFESWS